MSPKPRFQGASRPETSEQGSAIREFDFTQEAPTAPATNVDLLIEQALTESGEFPFGWSLAPPPTEKPTLFSPPSEEVLELCAERPTPILPVDDFIARRPARDRLPEIALRDPGPPLPPAFSRRPTAPPGFEPEALSRRPTLAASHPEPILAWPHEPLTLPNANPKSRGRSPFQEPPRTLPETEYLGSGPPPLPSEMASPSTRRRNQQSNAPSADGFPDPCLEPIRPGGIRILKNEDQLRALPLDHRAGFLLSMVGMVQSVDELLDISGMSRGEAMRLLCDLVDLGVIDLG
jgi:hypothetical protein